VTAVAEPTIEERVGRGATWFDTERPGWWQRTDLARFDVLDPDCCPLGQEYGHFDDAPADVALDPAYGFYRATQWPGPYDEISDEAIRLTEHRIRVEYGALTDAWRAEILRRRAAAGAAVMARLMSVALTQDAVRARQKTVTRRLGWEFLKPGDRITLCPKVMGHRKGETVERICDVEVISVRREELSAITWDDVTREGFPGRSTAFFIGMFCDAMKTHANVEVTRIEWRYLDGR
jgi:hypothetical protein